MEALTYDSNDVMVSLLDFRRGLGLVHGVIAVSHCSFFEIPNPVDSFSHVTCQFLERFLWNARFLCSLLDDEAQPRTVAARRHQKQG